MQQTALYSINSINFQGKFMRNVNILESQAKKPIHELSKIKTPAEIAKMKEAGRICAEILNILGDHIKPGVTTRQLDKLAGELITKYGAELDREDLEGYNYADEQNVFFTLNNIVARGMADDTPLNAGDILGIDISLKKDGWCGDTQKMYIVSGDTSQEAWKILTVGYECMWVGINKVKAGVDLGTIGHAVEEYVKSQGLNMVRFPGLTGHTIGQVHCEGLFVPFHNCKPGQGHVLEEGMVITIEPFITLGSGEAVLMPTDLRSVRTKDNTLGLFWEHVVAVTKDGCEVLDLRPGEKG
jgi:methionyl aminopeptidase